MTIPESPDGNADTSRDIETRPHNGFVFLRLCLERAGVGRERLDTHVQLRVSYVETERDVFVQRPREVFSRRRAADRHVCLQSNPMDGHARSLHELGDAHGAVGFDGEIFEVVCPPMLAIPLLDLR